MTTDSQKIKQINLLIDKMQEFLLFYIKNKEVPLETIIELNKIA